MAKRDRDNYGSIPEPDPTKLTTDAVDRSTSAIEKLVDVKLEGFRQLVMEMFSGRDTALAAALKAAQELVKQQNDSNAVAADKQEKSTTKQMDALGLRVDDLKERLGELNRKDWSTVGAYIVGAVGIAGLIVTALTWHH